MKLKLSALVSEVRGKLNGSVASRNRAGGYLRNKVTPLNRNTSFQAAVRATFTSFTKNWSNLLTNVQRGEWIAFALANTITNIFGDVRHLTGANYYLATNAALVNAGMATVTDPPASTAVGNIGGITLVGTVAAGGTLTAATNESNMPAGAKLNFYSTVPLSPGVNFVRSALRYIGTLPVGGSPYDIKSFWIAKYGAFPTTTGKKIFVSVQTITPAGVLSTPEGESVILS